METATAQRTTALGTPLSARWDAAWIAEVEQVESQLNRRICGAHTPAWTPCKLGPNHDNGRCRFHGGHPKIGAPKGNLNAVTHGLYMRRLQQCGTQCPLWQMCPLAGRDVLALDPKERPYCAYETEEYVATLKTLTKTESDREGECPREPSIASRRAAENAEEGPPQNPQGEGDRLRQPHDDNQPQREDVDKDLASSGAQPPDDDAISFGSPFAFAKEKVDIFHNIALYQTMLSRATAAVRVFGLTDEYLSEGENFRASSTRVGAILNAQLRIARELRQWIRLAANDAVQGLFGMRADESDPEDDAPRGLPDIAKEVLAQTEGVLEQCLRPLTDEDYEGPGAPIRPSHVGIDGPFGGTDPARA